MKNKQWCSGIKWNSDRTDWPSALPLCNIAASRVWGRYAINWVMIFYHMFDIGAFMYASECNRSFGAALNMIWSAGGSGPDERPEFDFQAVLVLCERWEGARGPIKTKTNVSFRKISHGNFRLANFFVRLLDVSAATFDFLLWSITKVFGSVHKTRTNISFYASNGRWCEDISRWFLGGSNQRYSSGSGPCMRCLHTPYLHFRLRPIGLPSKQ